MTNVEININEQIQYQVHDHVRRASETVPINMLALGSGNEREKEAGK
jgi:hypothetical protein